MRISVRIMRPNWSGSGRREMARSLIAGGAVLVVLLAGLGPAMLAVSRSRH